MPLAPAHPAPTELEVIEHTLHSRYPLAAKRIEKEVHVKDIAPAGENANEDGWADVGHGTMDWDALYAAAKQFTNARYFVMEHDNPADVDRFASRSIATVNAWK